MYIYIFTPCRAEQQLQVTRKRSTKTTKILKHNENLFRKNVHLIGVC